MKVTASQHKPGCFLVCKDTQLKDRMKNTIQKQINLFSDIEFTRLPHKLGKNLSLIRQSWI